jgi:hypothetical protein
MFEIRSNDAERRHSATPRMESRMRNRRPEVGSSRASVEPTGQFNSLRCLDAPHGLEQAVHRRLRSQPGLQIASLVIRRIPNGVCLEGILESQPEHDVCNLARSVAGVDAVLNHLVVRSQVHPAGTR